METNVYQVVKNGDIVVLTHSDKSRALHRAVSLARNTSNYVELWFINGDGSRSLLNYWN